MGLDMVIRVPKPPELVSIGKQQLITCYLILLSMTKIVPTVAQVEGESRDKLTK